jgi:cytochrome c2
MQIPMNNRLKRLQHLALAICTILIFQVSGLNAQSIWEVGDPINGQVLFNTNCASCHKITDEVLVGPGLAGIQKRWKSSDDMLVQWVQNPQEAYESGDKYIKSVVNRYVGTYGWMTGQAVSKEEVGDIMAYVIAPPEDGSATADSSADCPTIDYNKVDESDSENAIWFLILFILFIIIALSASGVKRSLTDILAEKNGEDLLPDSSYLQRFRGWAWNNLVFVSLTGLFFVLYGVVVGYSALMDIGTYPNYSPEQPIAFIHSVHVCENEIDCKYCHNSAYDSKHAGIPSTNVCMNCHKAVKKGKRTGTTEIEKIYAAIGFDSKSGTYFDGEGNIGNALPQDSYDGEPIKWNKVHNLPDHVYFSHQQHVNVGGLQCQNCHGDVSTYSVGRLTPVEEINELVDAFPGLIQLSKPTLTMGWCIECHNKAEVDMTSNGYYEELHERLNNSERGNEELRRYLEDDKITVRELGGWECSKCHY